jgi:hypothetical protein
MTTSVLDERGENYSSEDGQLKQRLDSLLIAQKELGKNVKP